MRTLTLTAAVVTFCLIALGAYVRLSDAGLGCPDWPGCYGRVGAPDEPHEIAQAEARFPDKPVEARKARIEMLHRYVAMALGVLIIGIVVLSWRQRREAYTGIGIPLLLLVLVILQGILGKWTVTWLLKPAVVTAHLLGGMTILALLTWLFLRQFRPINARRIIPTSSLKLLAVLGLIVLVAQITLGGWVSTNYAGLACPDFPTCRGAWKPAMDMANAFHVRRELGMSANGEVLKPEALVAIHWMHRVGALAAAAIVGVLALALIRRREAAPLGWWVLAALAVQLAIGVGNILYALPLPLAVAHNAGAALLLVTLVAANFQLNRKV